MIAGSEGRRERSVHQHDRPSLPGYTPNTFMTWKPPSPNRGGTGAGRVMHMVTVGVERACSEEAEVWVWMCVGRWRPLARVAR